METLNEFIVEIGKAFNNTITHGSLELYTDHRTQQQEQSNRRGKVVSLPMQLESDVEVGAEVVIDPTVLFQQTYKGKMQESRFLVNEEKGWYRVTPDMIILYKNPGKEWSGHKMNLFVEPVKNEGKETASGIFLPTAPKDLEGISKVAFANKELREEEGINTGDVVYHRKDMNWKFAFEGKEYLFLRNMDILGKRL